MKHNKVVFPYPKKNIRVNFCVNSHENAFVLRDLRAAKIFFNFHMQYSSYMDVKKNMQNLANTHKHTRKISAVVL